MPNRLAEASSPYLRQHADNPVDWYPWGEEAFARAKAENKPVFLSIGYASCHWCHVMAHECFEDPEVAEALNRGFVSVKVDREERPDVDETYMTAVQLQSGRGGWPMSVFLTPDKKPFFAATYIPKHDRGRTPGFLSVVRSIDRQWAMRSADVQAAADEFAGEITRLLERAAPQTFTTLSTDTIGSAVEAVAADFDREHGGFGDAPKFPPHAALQLLLGLALDGAAPSQTRRRCLGMALATLEAMALGGIHDHVGGGFHRYSTDAEWRLPHFEKMLYDNALLLGAYAHAARIARGADERLSSLFRRAAQGIVRWLTGEMASPEGLYASARDADSEGGEGKFYVWTYEELFGVLGPKAEAFAAAFGARPEGNFEDEATRVRTGENVLRLLADAGDRFDSELGLLRAARAKRPAPAADEKALVGWNGLAVAGLAEAGELELAVQAARAILELRDPSGRLPRMVVRSRREGAGFLEDYAYACWGLLALHAATGEAVWRDEAARIADAMVEEFYDPDGSGFFGTSERHENLFGRSKPALDQPIPSPNAVAIRCLIRLGDRARARASLDALFGWIEKAPSAAEALILAAWEYLSGETSERASAPAQAAETEPVVPEDQDSGRAAGESVGKPRVRVELEDLEAGEGALRGVVGIRIPQGMHINAHDPPMRWLVPTTVACEGRALEATYPQSQGLGYFEEVRIPFVVREAQRGEELELKVRFQACTDRECLVPEEVVLRATVPR